MDNREAQAVTFEESGHIEYKCPGNKDECERGVCQFCQGGLFSCTRCRSFEGATTTHCPDKQMTPDEHDAVYQGKLDYREDKWVEVGSPHSPNRGWDLYWNPQRELHYHKDSVVGTLPCRSEFCTFDPNTKIFNRRQTNYDDDGISRRQQTYHG